MLVILGITSPHPHKQSGGRETILLYQYQYIYVVLADSHHLLLATITLLHHQTDEEEQMWWVSHISFHFTYRWPYFLLHGAESFLRS